MKERYQQYIELQSQATLLYNQCNSYFSRIAKYICESVYKELKSKGLRDRDINQKYCGHRYTMNIYGTGVDVSDRIYGNAAVYHIGTIIITDDWFVASKTEELIKKIIDAEYAEYLAENPSPTPEELRLQEIASLTKRLEELQNVG